MRPGGQLGRLFAAAYVSAVIESSMGLYVMSTQNILGIQLMVSSIYTGSYAYEHHRIRLRCDGFKPREILLGNLGSTDLLLIEPSSKHFVEFRAHKVNKNHTENDAPFPF